MPSLKVARAGLVALAFTFPSVVAASPTGAPPPSGHYKCMTQAGSLLMQMGTLQIDGQTYRYAPTGGQLSSPAAYRTKPDGHLQWDGPMGALTMAPATITDSWVEQGKGYLSIIVKYKPRPNDYILTMGCRNDLH